VLVRQWQEVQALPRELSASLEPTSATAGEERILDWEGALNARDTGGLPTRDGLRIKPGALVRSDVISRLTPSGRRALIDHGVRTIVDVRTSEEIGRDVDYPFRDTRADDEPTYVNAPFVIKMTAEQEAEVRAKRETARDLGELNRMDIDIHGAGIREIIAAVADAQPGGVLIHCYAGKDRTGLSVGLLLSLAGVSDEDVADDYALTMLNLEPLIMEWLYTYEDEAERERMRDLATPRREAMLEMLEHLNERYGGAESYLRSVGVTQEQLDRIKTRLVEQPTND
jgi:protein tyrosine/serine phosphatase